MPKHAKAPRILGESARLKLSTLLACERGYAQVGTTFRPAWWCRGSHAQTIWAGALRRAPQVRVTRLRWELPDGDFLDVDELAADKAAPRIIVLHGLEGSSQSPQVRGMLEQARRRGWGGIAVNFRGCSGEPNRLRRSYHGGETGDLAWVVERLRAEHPESAIVLVGFSLGGKRPAEVPRRAGRGLAGADPGCGGGVSAGGFGAERARLKPRV